MKRKSSILTAVFIAVFIDVLFVGVLLFVLHSGTRDQLLYSGISDNGYQIAIDNELMIPLDVEIANSGATIRKAYCDGLRVYIDVQFADKSNIDIFKTALSDREGNILTVDKAVEKRDNVFVLIWNDHLGVKDVALQLTTSDGKTLISTAFQLSTFDVSVIEVENQFEEMFIHTITVGRTSTLFDMEVYTLLEIDRFQIEVQDEVRTSVYVLNDATSKHYSVLFPTVFEVGDSMVIYALDTSGNVLMSIPVSLGLQQ